MELAGSVALVTGGVRRLGRAIAQALAQAGSDLAIHHHSSSEEQAEGAATELRDLGRRVELFRADLTHPQEIERLFVEVEEAFGALDILVNNAAIFKRRPIDEISFEDWDRVLDLNLRAPFFCGQRAARLMNRRAAGRIINIADVGGLQPWSGYAHHSISKAGLIMMTKSWAQEFAEHNIRVNAIAPGLIKTDFSAFFHENPERVKSIERTQPIPRIGDTGELGYAALYLASDASSFTTGEVMVIDGGAMVAKGGTV